jgi:predicted ester cyclase
MRADQDGPDVLRAYLRAWEDCDVAAMERLVAPGFEHEVNGRWEDRDGLLARVSEADRVISRRRFEVDAIFADGPYVSCRCRLVGIHTGTMPLGPPLSELLGIDRIEPTGHEVSMSGMIVATVAGGRLVSGYGEWDQLGMLTQLLGPPAAATGRS